MRYRIFLKPVSLRLSPSYNLKSVGCEVQKNRFGNMRALLGRNPFIVQVRTAITLGIFDESRMNSVGDQFFYRNVSRHFAPPALVKRSIVCDGCEGRRATLSNSVPRDPPRNERHFDKSPRQISER